MLALPRVVLVDNNQGELDQLHHAIVHAGIPCIPVLYDAANWPPASLPKADALRLIFLDLNLLDGTPLDPKAMASHVARVLSKVVSNGPYILAFWSKHMEVVDEVMRQLQARHMSEVIPPLRYMAVNKLDFRLTEDAKKNR